MTGVKLPGGRLVPDPSLLEELLATDVPCGGVEGLHIPPCGSPAAYVLDRRNGHRCLHRERTPSDYKCVSCYQKWLDAVVAQLAENSSDEDSGVYCKECWGRFDRISDFARYVPL